MSDLRMTLKRRFRLIYLIFFILFVVIAMQLSNLQIENGEQYESSAQDRATKTLALTGSRGSIYDANGVVMAYDQVCYNVTFYREPGNNSSAARKVYSDAIWQAICLIEENGGTVIDDFAVYLDENGAWALNFNTESEEIFAAREELWRKNFYITDMEKYPTQVLFDTLCQWYCVPEELDYESRHKILSVWQEMQMHAFLGNPIVIAENVSFETVAKLSALKADLSGIDIQQDTQRVYPLGETAAHIIGYMGKMQSEETLALYKAMGYSSDDTIGITGIESTMEQELSANMSFRRGSQIVEVDANGAATQVLSYQPASNGNNVILTIDLEFQRVVEKALADNIEATRVIQHAEYEANQEEYDALVAQRGGSPIKYAQTGAAVVMEVDSGRVLALASAPSYDLSLFEGGISTENYQMLIGDERSPLFNKAISSRETPGSVFKMVTALAGLEEQVITETEIINDEGRYDKYDAVNGPRCWTSVPTQHSDQTVLEAIRNSCNYYFYEVADRLGIDRLSLWTTQLGLTLKTNVELTGESTGVVGSQSTLYDPEKTLAQQGSAAKTVENNLRALLVGVGDELGRAYDEERIDRVVESLMQLVGTYSQQEQLDPIRDILLSELGLTSADISQRYLVNQVASYINDLRWTPTQTIMTGIGQAITQVTPIAVARYISAIANGGTVYEANIVDRVVSDDGRTVMQSEPTVISELGDISDSLKIIQNGMHGVTSQEDHGTAYKHFVDYKYTDQIGAKTGTAQVSRIDLENHSWFVAYAPFDDPQIAVVVFIPNGYSGASSAPAIKDIIEYYLDKAQIQRDESIYLPGVLIP